MDDLVKNSKKSIYCQIQFLISIYTKDSSGSSSINSVDFFDIVRDSIIYFDKSEDEIKRHEKSNPYVARLMKMDVNGECFIDWQDDDLKVNDFVKDYKETDGIYDFSPILFVYQVRAQQKSNNNLCQKYRLLYGLMVFDQDSYQAMGEIFDDSGYAVKRNSTDGWDNSLSMKTIYGNSIVVIDDYLLCNTNQYNNNLYEILNTILPWEIKIPFYITFICDNNNKDFAFRYKKIKNKIAKLRPKYFNKDSDFYGLIRVNIIEDKKNVFHDRVILTNYCWISCGSGFDLYNEYNRAKHSTNVSILYPFIQHHVKWAKETYLNFLCDSRDVYSDAIKGNNNWFEETLFENRLYMMDSITEYLRAKVPHTYY